MRRRITATEFKAKCLGLIDEVHDGGEPVTITKHGRVVARLIPEFDETARPWLTLRGGIVTWRGDPFAPAVDAADVKALA